MGEIVGAGIVAHVPTIMLPEEVRLEINDGKEITLVPGLRRLRIRGPRPAQAGHVHRVRTPTGSRRSSTSSRAHEQREGMFTSHELPRGMRQIPYDMPGDPELAFALRSAGGGPRRHLGPRLRRPLPADLLRHDQHLDLPEEVRRRWMSVGINQCGTTEDFLLLGELIGEAVLATDRRVVLLASGGHDAPVLPVPRAARHESSEAPREHPAPRGVRGRPARVRIAAGGRPRGRHRLDARVPEGRRPRATSGTT